MTFNTTFLDALGRWLRGWHQDPDQRMIIAEKLMEECRQIPPKFKTTNGKPLYRKRHLYYSKSKPELVPLFLNGELYEGSPTSWTYDLEFAKAFDKTFDESTPNSAAGAIFCHTPKDTEIALNIHDLMNDDEFIDAAEKYIAAKGIEAIALNHFMQHQQKEVILDTSLRLDDIILLSHVSNFDSLCETAGASSEEDKELLNTLLLKANIHPGDPRYLSAEGTKNVIPRVIEKFKTLIQRHTNERIVVPSE